MEMENTTVVKRERTSRSPPELRNPLTDSVSPLRPIDAINNGGGKFSARTFRRGIRKRGSRRPYTPKRLKSSSTGSFHEEAMASSEDEIMITPPEKENSAPSNQNVTVDLTQDSEETVNITVDLTEDLTIDLTEQDDAFDQLVQAHPEALMPQDTVTSAAVLAVANVALAATASYASRPIGPIARARPLFGPRTEATISRAKAASAVTSTSRPTTAVSSESEDSLPSLPSSPFRAESQRSDNQVPITASILEAAQQLLSSESETSPSSSQEF